MSSILKYRTSILFEPFINRNSLPEFSVFKICAILHKYLQWSKTYYQSIIYTFSHLLFLISNCLASKWSKFDEGEEGNNGDGGLTEKLSNSPLWNWYIELEVLRVDSDNMPPLLNRFLLALQFLSFSVVSSVMSLRKLNRGLCNLQNKIQN